MVSDSSGVPAELKKHLKVPLITTNRINTPEVAERILAGGEAWVNRQVLACRPMVWLGLVSYPLYLWHWPLLSLAQIVESDTPPGKIRVAAMLLSVLLAWLTYRLLEKPIRFGRGSGRTVAVLCATVATLGGVGYATSVQQGIPTRSIAKANAQNKFDYPYRQSCAPLMGAPHADDWCHAGNATTAPPQYGHGGG